MNVKKRGAVQVNRPLRGKVTFGITVRGTKRGERGGKAQCRKLVRADRKGNQAKIEDEVKNGRNI